MTNEQILRKAIEKAVKNGFKYAPYKAIDGVHPIIIEIPEIAIYKHLIFSHDFAKAVWGDWEKSLEENVVEDIKSGKAGIIGGTWQYHLQQMILEPNPLQYLKKFL